MKVRVIVYVHDDGDPFDQGHCERDVSGTREVMDHVNWDSFGADAIREALAEYDRSVSGRVQR